MKTIRKQLLAAICSVVCILSCLNLAVSVFGSEQGASTGEQSQITGLGYSSKAAPSLLDSVAGIFSTVEVTKAGGSDSKRLPPGESVEVHMDFKADSLQEGDTIVISLPDELLIVSGPNFTLYNSMSLPIATASIDATANTVTVTFNGNVTGLHSITGQLTYTAVIDSVEAGPYDLQFKENDVATLSTPITIEKGESTNYNKLVHKWGTLQSDGSIVWTVYVNFSLSDLSNAVLVDELGDGLAVVSGSVRVYRCNNLRIKDGSVTFNEVDVTGDFTVDYSDDGFKIVFDKLSEGYKIVCTTTITNPSVKEYENKATLHHGDDLYYYWWNSVFWSYGGNATGDYNGKLKLVKRDAETLELLPGAHFDLLDANQSIVAELVTDDDGVATAERLEIGADYYLVETQPPAGYEASGEKTTVGVTSGDELQMTIYNQRTPEPDPKPDPQPDPEPDPEPNPNPDPDVSTKPDPEPDPDPPPSKPGGSTGSRDSSGGTDRANAAKNGQVTTFEEGEPSVAQEEDDAGPPVEEPEYTDTQNPLTGYASSTLSLVTALASLGGAALLLRHRED